MAIVLRSVKGSNLTAAEVDGNFSDLVAQIAAIIAGIPEPVNISNITVTGTRMTIYLADATVFGPFTLPQANFRPSVVGVISTTTHTVVSGDLNGFKRCTNAAGCAWTFDDDSFAVDSEVTIYADTDGPVTFDSTTDIQLRVPPGYLPQVKGNGFTAGFKKLAAGLWVGIGTFAEDVTA
ncbi:hypothetical protein [Mesorhizobium opportunistum]|uniref:Uncharacterized protein n=1 Tax=Mesorhizobium opportunistum (strain LMG 24607 / HAMBI 3007 / WSM2075) TaxID=536019 RepID=F7Y0Z4_MESOW|nr:hypothetical protein [Mesorhizobium opportunistum]AEH88207.1 hypothetical protein Mesop_3766 [Mesorhizobium opportunistum WSM2075]